MIDIVMPTWNQANCTIECVQSLRKHTLAPFRLIWVDDGSKRAERDIIQKHIEESGITHKMIYHEKNLGFTKSINDGIRACESSYLALINNDILVTEGWLKKLIFLLDDNRNMGIVSALCSSTRRVCWHALDNKGNTRVYPSGIEKITKHNCIEVTYDDSGPENFFNKLEPMFFCQPKNLPPVCCLVRRELFDDIGLFNEEMKMFGSDNEFSFRVRSHPRWFKAVAVNCFIYHKGHVSVSKLAGHGAGIRRDDRLVARKSFKEISEKMQAESKESADAVV